MIDSELVFYDLTQNKFFVANQYNTGHGDQSIKVRRLQIMKLFLIIIMSLLPLNSLTQDNYECDDSINTEAEATSCAMWHSRVISELSINGYKFIATETESGWIIEHANLPQRLHLFRFN